MKLIVIAILIAAATAISQQVTTPVSYVTDGERCLLIKGRIAGDLKNWLVIESHNGVEWKKNGFDPTYVRLVSDYKPMFRRLSSGQWETIYVSELTQKGAGIP